MTKMKYSIIHVITLTLICFIITNSTILITSPAINPFDQSKIPYSYANFGYIPYGKTLTFDLKQLQDVDLCQSMENITHIIQPTYLLIDASKGTCSFTTQSINAQILGAKGIVFVSHLISYYGKVVQADDGNGRKVHITALFISPSSYRSLQSIKNIHIKVIYQVYKTDKVNFTYFLTASGRTNYIFLRQFMPYYEKIKDYIIFRPLYLTFKCPFCSQKDCLVSTDYCMFQMDIFKDDVGQYILKQQLRQWNIWRKQGAGKYLTYMNDFDKYCSTNWLLSQQCGQGIMKSLQIQNIQLQFSPTNIMDGWKIQQNSGGFITTPQITLNQALLAGSMDPLQVFDAICQNLKTPPSSCYQNAVPKSSSKFGWIIIVIVVSCILSIILGYFIYKKCVKKELTKDMFSKVNQLVAKYATKVSQHNKKRKDRLKMRLNQEL